ncbi:AMP-binding enzyme [Peribacillus frigoritolerans]|uniref:AMP-binding enzyme n=1 Tax=Peribacillus frigoritolerans TaxID=450367 RepID=UPI003800758D
MRIIRGAHERGGGYITVIVTRNSSRITEDEIRNFVREKLANYKVPKSVLFTAELSKSGASKILKRQFCAANIGKNKQGTSS